MEMGANSLGVSGSSSGSSDSLHGLAFGKKIYFEDGGGGGGYGGSSSNAPVATSPAPVAAAAAAPPQHAKKGKGVVHGGKQQPPRCQVEGCHVDLTGAKAYYCRHKVCGMHSKAPKVMVAGLEQRFCQQCSSYPNLTKGNAVAADGLQAIMSVEGSLRLGLLHHDMVAMLHPSMDQADSEAFSWTLIIQGFLATQGTFGRPLGLPIGWSVTRSVWDSCFHLLVPRWHMTAIHL